MKQYYYGLVLMAILILQLDSLRGQISDGGSLPQSFVQSDLFEDSIPLVLLPPLDLAVIMAEDEINDRSGTKAPRFGVLMPVDIGWENGSWTTLSSGDRIWRLKIRAAKARATNYYFDDFYMPDGAKMHIFSPDRSEMIGGFGAHNNSAHSMFSTALIHGEEAIIEYYEPMAVSGQGRLHISEVNHAYRMVGKPDRSTKRDFGDSDPCEVNVNCSPEGDGKTQQRDAVARILVRAGNSAGWCSGTMINNARQDCKPYFLTALHCADDGNGNIITQNDFNQWVFYFNYQAAGCTNPANEGLVPNNTITGADVRADSEDPNIATGSDLLLLEFQNAVPANYNVFFAGWNRSATATTGGFGIHHPAGDIKKISTFTGTTTSTGWNQPGVTHWSLSWSATTNGHGVTEGGSSGSGLFDNNGLLIGSLSGGSSFCTSPNASDSYGKFSHHWDQNGVIAARRLKDWLDPDNTGVMSLAGTYFPCQSNDLDAGISAIVSPSDGGIFCENPFSPEVTLKNFGTTTLTSVIINYKINNETPTVFAWNGSLGGNDSVNIVLPALAAPGVNGFTLRAYTSSPNGGMDQLASNDTSTIMTQYSSGLNLPYTQNFGTGIPAEIQIVDGGNDGFKWVHNSIVNGFGAANNVGSMLFDNYTNDTRGTIDLAYLPALNLSGSQNSKLQFDVAYAKFNNEFNDTLIILASNDCRTSWQTIYKKGGTDLATAPDFTSGIFIPNGTQWRTEMVDLSNYDGSGHVSLVMINVGGYGQQLFVDNISVNGDVSEPYQILSTLQKFSTLEAAVLNATPGDTIKLINHAVETAPLELPLGYIFDFPMPFNFTVNIP